MNRETQTYLVQIIAEARVGSPLERDENFASNSFRGFSSAMTALRAVGMVSDEESHEWTNRMLVALGEGPLEPLPSGSSVIRSIVVGPKSSLPPDIPPISRFLGLIAVEEPDRPLGYGGRIQILGLERYDTKLAVAWRLAPLPDPEIQYLDQLSAHDQDAEGLTELQRRQLRRQLLGRLGHLRERIRLVDSVETMYQKMGGGSGGSADERVGRTEFMPSIPDSATWLSVFWEELEFVVPLDLEA
jgi:hypothetical protein